MHCTAVHGSYLPPDQELMITCPHSLSNVVLRIIRHTQPPMLDFFESPCFYDFHYSMQAAVSEQRLTPAPKGVFPYPKKGIYSMVSRKI
jgi:hypothetical protein